MMSNGYIEEGRVNRVLQHRRIVGEMIGRPLKKREVVHHVDENPSNNDRSNLQYFRHNSAHCRLHRFADRHGIHLSFLRIPWEKIYAAT